MQAVQHFINYGFPGAIHLCTFLAGLSGRQLCVTASVLRQIMLYLGDSSIYLVLYQDVNIIGF